MQVIRASEFRRMPIIALTAEAMEGDRENMPRCRCVPELLATTVNTEQMLSALRMWLHR